MIKKYHIADVLTLCEVIFTFILLGMTILDVTVDIVIWIFIAGELCDAFDGICARKWHYPDDGKYRWWRTYASQIDQATDVFLAIVCGLYLLFRIQTVFALCLVIIETSICTGVQWMLILDNKLEPIANKLLRGGDAKLSLGITLFRRYVYVVGIASTIVIMIFATSWSEWAKILSICLGVAAGLVLVIVKRNRLTQDKTPLQK